ncbi:NADH-quinone oxidoreductase subunit M [Patulibacter sp. SYSU D01012]|uniref:complex I subunit 4 family protein n=1 Tax=Patulibacter sp. SYSU D01012 TaxID=2817381 RepID=UPI001B315DEF|nr:NADH-quinone oxidoreductase subunit M [Patulibacter sp. SYSU D01012]
MLHLSILLWLPVVFGLLGLLVPERTTRWVSLVGALLTLALSIAFVVDFDTAGATHQHVTSDAWISALGVRYELALSGLNVWLVLLTTVGFAFSIAWTAVAPLGTRARAKHVFLHLAIAETAVVGALLAQDLILFVAFFDLMLIPFFFLTAMFGNGDRVPATIKMVVYTLVGSLLMLVAAIAVGVLATPAGASVSYDLATIAQRGVPEGSQGWLFACFAAAFLVKMPAFPIHGWVADGYRAMPLPILAVFSGVLSKIAAYGFLQIAVPLLPQGTADLRWIVIVMALLSILYASSIALTTTNARLVLAYSSIAQLGFITLGLMSLRTEGASGAIFQSINHGVAVFGAFLAVAILSARAGGSEDLRDMGGAATKAPVFAVLFVVVTYAVLAMPGTANFVGEFLILRGAWEGTAPAVTIIASIGIALAAVYALRLFIRSAHNRVGPKMEPREASRAQIALLAVPVVLIAALALHPSQTVDASDVAATRSVLPAAAIADRDGAQQMLSDLQDKVGGEVASTGGGQAGAPAGDVAIDPSTGQPVDPAAAPAEPSAQTEGAGR